MRLLDRYIAKTVLAAIALVTLMLSGLQIFILFVNQLDAIGKANYGLLQATAVVLLQMPYQVYLFFPMASLLGSLIGLGILANHSELIVMRAAGMSIWQVILAVFKAALIVIVIVTVTGETLVPKLSRIANDQKMQALSRHQALRTANGVWLRYHNDFISVDTVLPNNELQEVYQFHFDASHHLQFARKLQQIVYHNGVWSAHGVEETIIHDKETTTKKIDDMDWDVAISPYILGIGSREPDEMTLKELHRYIDAQNRINQKTLNYKLAYWQRIVQPLTTAVMMLLAIPFIFGPLRSTTMGYKLVAGATVGFGFHIINQFFGPMSQVLQLPPEIAAFGPTLLFAVLGIYLMRRVK